MKAKEFERRFDAGEDIMEALDLTKARRPRLEPKRAAVGFPVGTVEKLEKEAAA